MLIIKGTEPIIQPTITHTTKSQRISIITPFIIIYQSNTALKKNTLDNFVRSAMLMIIKKQGDQNEKANIL